MRGDLSPLLLVRCHAFARYIGAESEIGRIHILIGLPEHVDENGKIKFEAIEGADEIIKKMATRAKGLESREAIRRADLGVSSPVS